MSASVVEIDEGDGWKELRCYDSYKTARLSGSRLSRDFTAVRVRRHGQLLAQWDRGHRLSTLEIQAINCGARADTSAIQYKPAYTPPERPERLLKDPITGVAAFFEVVFDGR
jgi:hypothetical protein